MRKQTRDLLREESDYVETVTVPSDSSFKSVGRYYQNFLPVEDEQVIGIMKKLTCLGCLRFRHISEKDLR